MSLVKPKQTAPTLESEQDRAVKAIFEELQATSEEKKT